MGVAGRHDRSVVRRSGTSRGFTLAELMVVVVIMGVLATLATYAVTSYVRRAKASEATSMIADIKIAEENYKDEMFVYLGNNGTFDPWYPPSVGKFKTTWGGDSIKNDMGDMFSVLGVHPHSATYFQYSVAAGRQGDGPPTMPTDKTDFNFPSTASEPFYVTIARADLDGDGKYSYVVAHSYNSDIYVEHEGE